jgi:hypothetical protein
MEGVYVADVLYIAFDCEEINVKCQNIGQAELLPLLECFSRGQFTRAKMMKMVHFNRFGAEISD